MPIFLKARPRVLYLRSSVDINLAVWIQEQGVIKGDIKVIIPAGEIIGSTGAAAGRYALNVGNIDQYDSVTLDVLGEVQALGGISGVITGAYEGLGGNAIYSARPLTINISGAVKGGGGAGGAGGNGGVGDERGPVLPPKYSRTTVPTSYVFMSNSTTSRYGGGSVPGIWGTTSNYIYKTAGGNIYGRVTLQETNYYSINVGTHWPGVAGAGGNGGLGQGYLQPRTDAPIGEEVGAPVAGTSRAGNGGVGGNGGDWGLDGVGGSGGDNGLYYSRTSTSASSTGADGIVKGLGGYSVYALDGPATGIIVNNTGTMNGREYY